VNSAESTWAVNRPVGERRLIVAFCVLAAVRVLIYAAAFPFFNNVDELAHFDLVMRYGQGHIPRSLETTSPEAAAYIARYGSPEYLHKLADFPDQRVPAPVWKKLQGAGQTGETGVAADGSRRTLPSAKLAPTAVGGYSLEKVQRDLEESQAAWRMVVNHEASQPPLYYFIAGLWSDLGSLCGLKGMGLLYWIRFLNVFFAAALVWVAYLAALAVSADNLAGEGSGSWSLTDKSQIANRKSQMAQSLLTSAATRNRFVVLGVPLLAAVLPQDTYYSIQSDVLSPLCFGLAFVNLAAFLRAEVPSPRRAILAGLTLAATVLVKASNLPLLAVALIAVLLKLRRFTSGPPQRYLERRRAAAAPSIAEFALCALVPVLIWFLWNLATYGDLTGTSTKIGMLGWTANPLSNWFHHPIFTPRGAWTFWSELMASFWRGELVWFGVRLAMPAADVFYWLSSLVFVVLGVVGFSRTGGTGGTGRTEDDYQRRLGWLAFWSFASLVIFMGLLSVGFDFGKCYYPSQARPYFTSGRLVSAALIPFLLLYVQGLDRALFWIKSERWRLGILAAMALFVTLSEIIVNRAPFSSQYNLFHL
jgi:hypothetical protein